MAKSGQTMAARRAGVIAAFAAALSVVFATGYFVVAALASPSVPAPTITGSPANPTASTSAAFTFADSLSGVSFKCSLDSASFAACASGVSYTHLVGGHHTFTVEAKDSHGSLSLPTSYGWLVDTAAPAITVTFPAAGGTYNATHWSSGCATAGICGTAADPSSVSGVAVGIYQQSSKKYWDGSSFSSPSLVLRAASGTTAWHYGFTPPQDGGYTVYVRATDGLGNTTGSVQLATVTFTYDTMPPAAPVIILSPAAHSTDTSPEFRFTDTGWPDLTFSCWLDSGTHMGCTGDTDHDGDHGVEGEWHFANLAPGQHCFYVVATDKAGNVGPVTQFCWAIGAKTTNFAVGGDLTAPLYPGTSQPLNLTFTNPGSSPLTIARGAVSTGNITITSSVPGCPSSNFAVTQGLTTAITIPSFQFTPTSLSALGVPQADWPVITMIETHTNQDACQGAKLTLAYSGIEASG